MILARVLGNIVATQKNRRYENASVMLCQQVDLEGEETTTTILALNAVDAWRRRYGFDCAGRMERFDGVDGQTGRRYRFGNSRRCGLHRSLERRIGQTFPVCRRGNRISRLSRKRFSIYHFIVYWKHK